MLVRVRHRRLSWFRPALGCLVVALLLGFAPRAVPGPTVRSAQAQLSLHLSAQIGGASDAMLVAGDVAWIAEGPRVVAYGVAADGSTQGSDAVLPRLATGPILPGVVRDLSMVDDHLVVAAGPEGGVIVLDVSDFSNVAIVGALDTPGAAAGVAALGSRVAVADGDEGLLWLDFADPSRPSALARVPLVGFAARVTIVAEHAVVAMGRAPWDATWPGSEGALAVVDLIRGDEPTLRAMLEPGGAPMALTADGELAYAAVRRPAAEERPADEALVVVDVDGPGDGDNEPRLLGAGIIGDGLDRDGLATGLAPFGRYVLAGGARVRVVDLYDPTQPVLLRRLDAPAAAIALSPAGAVLAVPRGGIALHATGRGGQLYHRATLARPGHTVGVLAWPSTRQGSDRDGALDAVSLVDRSGLWRIEAGAESSSSELALRVSAPPTRVTGGRVQGASSMASPSGALLRVDGGVAGPYVDVLRHSSAATDGTGTDAGTVPAAVAIGAWRAGLPPADVAMTADGRHALVLDSSAVVADPDTVSLHVVDLLRPERPRTAASLQGVAGEALAVSGDVAYVLNDGLELWSFEKKRSGLPKPMNQARARWRAQRLSEVEGPAEAMAVAGEVVFLHDGDVLREIDVSDPTMPSETRRWPLAGPPRALHADARFVALALGDRGVALVDRQADPAAPVRLDTPGDAVAVRLLGEQLFVADGEGGLLSIGIEQGGEGPPAPSPTTSADAAARARSVMRAGEDLDTERPTPGDDAGAVAASVVAATTAITGQDGIVVEDSFGGETRAMLFEDERARGQWVEEPMIGRGARLHSVLLGDEVPLTHRLRSPVLRGVVVDLAYVEFDREINPVVAAALAGTGVQLLRLVDGTRLETTDFLPLPDATALTVIESTLWVAAGGAGLYGVDVVNPLAPRQISHVETRGEALDVAPSGSDLVVALGDAGIAVFNVQQPDRPVLRSRLALEGRARGLDSWKLDGGGAGLLVSAGRAGVHQIDLSDPNAPVLWRTFPQPIDPPVGPVGEAVAARYTFEPSILVAGAFVPDVGGAGLRIVRLPSRDGEAPIARSTIALPGEVHGLTTLEAGYNWMTTGSGGLLRYNHVTGGDSDGFRLAITHVDAPPGHAAAVAIDEAGVVWLGEGGDQPGVWRAEFTPGQEPRVLSGATMPLAPRALAVGANRGWALLEGDLLQAFDVLDVGEGEGVLGRSAVLPAPGAIALAARSDEAAWVAPAPEGSLEPDLRLVGLGQGSSLAVTRRQRLPGTALDVVLPGSPGSVQVAGDEAGLLAIQLAEAGRTPIVWDGALDAPARRVALAEDTVWVDDGRGRLHRLWLERPALPKLLGSIALPDAAPLRDLDAGRDGAWLVLADGAVGFVDATVAISQTTLLTATLPAPALQIAATDDGARAVAAAGAAGWVGLRSPLAEPGGPAKPPAIFIPKAER